ncbi:hypothetical protein PsYK624_066180 [Phanerochaete sordida]|uniref:Uncharacterized protein n=1 Tax=Phanerochaete sordida TaxID=48140 RepID=A0A9P3G940_9APHY|nr:hypothetical protein PsYK624_066180 [Phanerochaete sordida]
MRLTAAFLHLVFVVTVATRVAAVSIRADVVELAAREVDIVKKDVAVFSYSGNEVMAPHDVELVRRAGWTYNNNQALFLAILAKNAYVINATCSSGNVVTCAIGVTYSFFTFFFTVFRLHDRTESLSDDGNPFFAIAPAPGKSLRRRLMTELAEGEWHYVGHVHHTGINHTVHYFNHGSGIHQLRARTVPFWDAAVVEKRLDEDNDGGFVGDYYWNNDNEGPYDSFHSTSAGTSYFAANAGGYMINS